MPGRWRRLPPRDRALLVRAAALLPVAAAAVRLLDLATARRLALRAAGRPGAAERASPAPPARLGWAVEAAARRLPGTTCLVRAVAAEALLRSRSLPASLLLGLTPGRGSLAAHAWVECGGEVVAGGGRVGRAAVALPLPD